MASQSIIWESEVQRAKPLSPVKSADERSEESATCPSGMKWSEGVNQWAPIFFELAVGNILEDFLD